MTGWPKSALRRAYHLFLAAIPAKQSLAVQHYRRTGRWPNIDRPSTFNEKVLNRKFYEQNDLFTRLADKVAVKDYIRDVAGEQYIVPTLHAGKHLPADACERWSQPVVVKANHASGCNIFVMDPKTADWAGISRTVDQLLSRA